MVKPSFFQHGDLYDLEAATGVPVRLTYEGLWCWTDRECRFEWNPEFLKLNILPYDKCVKNCGRARCYCTMSIALDALWQGGFIFKYQVAGKSYGLLPTLTKHQSINKNEAASECPAPPPEIYQEIEQRALDGGFHMYRDASSETHRNADAGSEMHMHLDGKGKERSGTEREEDQKHVEQPAAQRDAVDALADSLGISRAELERRIGLDTFVEGAGWEGPKDLSDESMRATQEQIQQDLDRVRDDAIAAAAAAAHKPGSALMAPEQKLPARRAAQPLPRIAGKATVERIEARLAAVGAEIAEGRRRALTKQQQRELFAEIVFTYWVMQHGHKKAIFDKKRAARIEARLEENEDDLSELFYAVDGGLKDKAIQGQMHDGDQKYDGIETIFRDRAQIERLARQIPAYRKDVPHPQVEKYREAFNINSDINPEGDNGNE
jgi:hypothetical protein